MTRYGVGTFVGPDGDAYPGLVVEETVIDLRPRLGPDTTTLTLLEEWDDTLERLGEIAAAASSEGVPFRDVRPLAPVASRQILCAGANYAKHVREMAFAGMRRTGDTRPDEAVWGAADEAARTLRREDPFMFVGLPSALSGAHDDITLWGPGTHHDWEIEIAAVIGRAADSVAEADAMDHVAGFTICHDVTSRDMQFRPNLPMTDFLMAKCRPTWFPTGPLLVPRDQVGDPAALRLTLSVNGELMQDELAADMIHGVARLVSYASRATPLAPGDMVLTGSPAGNAGSHGNRWLQPGDLIEAEITCLGRQRNRCVEP